MEPLSKNPRARGDSRGHRVCIEFLRLDRYNGGGPAPRPKSAPRQVSGRFGETDRASHPLKQPRPCGSSFISTALYISVRCGVKSFSHVGKPLSKTDIHWNEGGWDRDGAVKLTLPMARSRGIFGSRQQRVRWTNTLLACSEPVWPVPLHTVRPLSRKTAGPLFQEREAPRAEGGIGGDFHRQCRISRRSMGHITTGSPGDCKAA